MSRWVIVSNRLPFSYDRENKILKESSGGLVTAIRGIKSDVEKIWVGLIENEVPKKLLTEKQTKGISYSFLQTSTELYDQYYNGFCNDVLWPMLHYESEIVKFETENWKAYQEVNEAFAEHILKVAKDDDLIWIHDFHLFLVPKILKEKNPKLKIGFFLHVPFPSSEVYRHLPCREAILESLIASDLIGFHDFSYLRHFVSSVYNLLGIHSSMLEIQHNGHHCQLGVFPVSIDSKELVKKSNSAKTQKEIEHFGIKEKSIQYILGVDRLDYTKGILLKLRAFKYLLEEHPEVVGRVQLIQIAVPSRTDVPEYISLRHEVEMLVSEINGKFSTINYLPVKYIFNSVTLHELLALYRSSDVLFITSKRDGMNLVCLEYIASQDNDDPGVVVLSEFAGAASTLSHAVIINPMNIADTKDKLIQALTMSLDERIERHIPMFNFLKDYSATDWAQSFLNGLENVIPQKNHRTQNLKNKVVRDKLKSKINGKPTTILLDYDGTLAPIKPKPEMALLSADSKSFIKKLAKQQNTDLVIVSGRPAEFLKAQFEGVDLFLAGEHGGKFYDYKTKKWRNLVSSTKTTWYNEALKIVEAYSRRTPGSFCEKKNFAITWHFRNSPNDFGEFQARKLVVDLEASLNNLPVSIIFGKKVVEIKAIEANKGYFTNWFKERYTQDSHVIAVGDDRTDEDMFEALGEDGSSIKVGFSENTHAKYLIEDQKNVIEYLKDIFQL
jgi:trehalose 6-phosphate synthase/phosphatase